MTKERRLGRGLEALLGRSLEPSANQPPQRREPGPQTGGLLQISVYEIEGNPFQPRRDFDDAETHSLCESIKQHGLLQPVVVRQVEGRYQLIAGERRLRAAIKAGWSQVPANLVVADDRQTAELAIVENLQRKDLNPLEKAASFRQYLERYECTQEELAGRLKIDRSTVANLIRLLELPEQVQESLRRGVITQGHARALLPLGEEADQIAFAGRIEAEGLSVRTTEELVHDSIHRADREPLLIVTSDGESQPPTRSGHLAELEQLLRAALGTKVDIRQTAKGRGRIVIHFAGHEEFERLEEYLCRRDLRTEQRQIG